MTSWDRLLNHLDSHYDAQETSPGYVLLEVRDVDGPIGALFLSKFGQLVNGHQYVEFAAPVVKATPQDAERLARGMGQYPLGGILVNQDMVMVRHVWDLDGFTAAEFEAAKSSVTAAAQGLARLL